MPDRRLNICLIEPFFSGSHAKWANEFKEHSRHSVELLTLPGRHWKWRMEGAAIELAQRFNERTDKTDLILCSDMLNLSLFNSLIREKDIPVVLYMHENQLTYPWSPQDRDVSNKRDFHYSFINYTSCLVANEVWFNSGFHLNSFLEELPRFLNMFPDFQGKKNMESIREKSTVIPIGIDCQELESKRLEITNEVPVIIWNHRWEFDKNPELFFRTLEDLKQEGRKFQLVVLGERTEMYPEIFDQIKSTFSHELLHWGYCEDRIEYLNWLWRSDIIPVTSNQDFFGISAVEGIYCHCIPLLPNRLAFPEHLADEFHENYLYHSDKDLKDKLSKLILEHPSDSPNFSQKIKSYNWTSIAELMDVRFEGLIDQQKHR